MTSETTRSAVASVEAGCLASNAPQAHAVVRPRSALSTLLVLLSLLVMVLPSFPQELWGAGVGAPVSSRGHDGLVSQGEVPSTGSAARLEVDDAMTPPSLSGSRVLGAASAPTLRGRSALSLGISADAPLHRPPRIAT